MRAERAALPGARAAQLGRRHRDRLRPRPSATSRSRSSASSATSPTRSSTGRSPICSTARARVELAETVVEELAAEPYGDPRARAERPPPLGPALPRRDDGHEPARQPERGRRRPQHRDISERKSLEEQLVHSAYHDSLTTLANRALFRERVDETLQELDGPSEGIAVLFLDLDGFKQVNDMLGHAAGRSAARPGGRAAAHVRAADDVVARLGGDEFGVLLEQADERDGRGGRPPDHRGAACAVHGRRPRDQRARQRRHRRRGPRATTATGLLRNADLAMYRAKAAGEGGFKRYDPDMHVDLVERLQLEADLRRAIDAEQLVLHYQPTVVLDDGRDHRRRGARPLEPSDARPRLAAPVHPARRGERPDRADRPLGAPRGVPAGRRVAARLPASRLLMSVNISGGQLSPRLRRRRRRRARRDRSRRRPASCSR